MSGLRYPIYIDEQIIKTNSQVYIFRVKNADEVFGTHYESGTLCLNEEDGNFWEITEKAKPYKTLNTISKIPFCMGDCSSSGGGTPNLDVKVALFDTNTAGYLLEKIEAGANVNFTLAGTAPNQRIVISSEIGSLIDPTGFERINGNVGTGGWALIGRDAGDYGTIGKWAIDASYSSGTGYTGAVADYSTAFGMDIKVEGWGAFAGGYKVTNSNNATLAFTYGGEMMNEGYGAALFGYYSNVAKGSDYSLSGGYKNKIGLNIGESVTWSPFEGSDITITGTADTTANTSLVGGGENMVFTNKVMIAGYSNLVMDDVEGLGYTLVSGAKNYVSARYSSVVGLGNHIQAEGGFVNGQNIHVEQIVPGSTNSNDQSKMNFIGGWGKFSCNWAHTWKITGRGHANMIWTDARQRDVTFYAYDSALIGGSDVQVTDYHWNTVLLGLTNRDNSDIQWDDTTYVENLAILTQPQDYGTIPLGVKVLARNTDGQVRELSLESAGMSGYHKYIIADNGFSIGQPLSYYGGVWQQADTSQESHTAQGIVVKIYNGEATLIRFGDLTLPSHGYTVGEIYGLDTSGNVILYPPLVPSSNTIMQTLFFVKDADTLQLNVELPVLGVVGSGSMSYWTLKEDTNSYNIFDEDVVEFEAATGIEITTQEISSGHIKVTIGAPDAGVDNFDDLTDTVSTKGDIGQVVEVIDDGSGGKELGYNSVPEISSEDTLAGRMKLAVVSSMPGTPDANTIYFIAL